MGVVVINTFEVEALWNIGQYQLESRPVLNKHKCWLVFDYDGKWFRIAVQTECLHLNWCFFYGSECAISAGVENPVRSSQKAGRKPESSQCKVPAAKLIPLYLLEELPGRNIRMSLSLYSSDAPITIWSKLIHRGWWSFRTWDDHIVYMITFLHSVSESLDLFVCAASLPFWCSVAIVKSTALLEQSGAHRLV